MLVFSFAGAPLSVSQDATRAVNLLYCRSPSKILALEFELILACIVEEGDKQLLTKWFKRDDNLVPSNYVLQSISLLLSHYIVQKEPTN